VRLLLLGLAVGVAGCATAPVPRPAPARAVRLTATLDSPTDVTLRWADPDPRAAGHVLEYANGRAGPYTPLGFLPPGQTSYRHPDLIPDTWFYYRVRPYYGPVSRPVELAMPAGSADKKDDYRWAAPRTSRGRSGRTIRDGGGAGAPTGFTGRVVRGDGIRFTWTDHARDEDGYLLEARPAGSGTYGVVALLDPDVTSFGLVKLPHEKTASYRVRPFYYGVASNLAARRTGAGSLGG
jgi:hypothetical protein